MDDTAQNPLEPLGAPAEATSPTESASDEGVAPSEHKTMHPLPGRRSRTARRRWRRRIRVAAVVLTGFIGAVGGFLGIIGYLRSTAKETKTDAIEARRKLDQAWDLLGGRPGTTEISVYSGSANDHELARRLTAEVLIEDESNVDAKILNAMYLEASGRLTEAESATRSVLQNVIDRDRAISLLGSILLKQGRHDEGLAAFRKAVELRPDSKPALGNLARALIAARKWAEAEPQIRRAAASEPALPGYHFDLGLVLAVLNKPRESLIAFRTTTYLDRQAPDPHTFSGHLLLFDLQQADQAPMEFEKAVALAPNDPGRLVDLGLAYHLLNDSQKSTELFARATNSAARFQARLCDLGSALMFSGDSFKAMVFLRRGLALEKSPARTARWAWLLANALREAGRPTQAGTTEALVAQIDPAYVNMQFPGDNCDGSSSR